MKDEIRRRITGVRKSSMYDTFEDNTETVETEVTGGNSSTTATLEAPVTKHKREIRQVINDSLDEEQQDMLTDQHSHSEEEHESTSNDFNAETDIDEALLKRVLETNVITTDEEKRIVSLVRSRGLEQYYRNKLLGDSSDNIKLDGYTKDSTLTGINFSDLSSRRKNARKEKQLVLKDLGLEKEKYRPMDRVAAFKSNQGSTTKAKALNSSGTTAKRKYKARNGNYATSATFDTSTKNVPAAKRSPDADQVKIWKEWSMTPHTEDEIREKILKDFNNVCFTYVCRFSKMSSEFIEEFMALSTGFLHEDNYEKYKDAVIEALQIKMGVLDKDMRDVKLPFIETTDNHGKAKIIPVGETLRDRLDWYYIETHQDLADWFKEKYASQLRKLTVVSEQQVIAEMTETAENMDDISDDEYSENSLDEQSDSTSDTSSDTGLKKSHKTKAKAVRTTKRSTELKEESTKEKPESSETTEDVSDNLDESEEDTTITASDAKYVKDTLCRAHSSKAGIKGYARRALTAKSKKETTNVDKPSETLSKLESELNLDKSTKNKTRSETAKQEKSKETEKSEKVETKSNKQPKTTKSITEEKKPQATARPKASPKKSIVVVNGNTQAKAMSAEQIDEIVTAKKKSKKTSK